MRKRKIKKQKKIIALSIIVLCAMVSGYAAFSTNLNLKAKGNIKEITMADKLRKTCNTSSDNGLYEDIYEENRCIYRGENPNNYLIFNDELWRIIALENDDTIKIIRSNSLGAREYDGSASNNRYNENNSYCTLDSNGANYSCNVWSAISGNYINGNYSGTVTEDADLNIYLNNEYYNSLNENAKEKIKIHNFKIGGLPNSATFQNYLNADNTYTWTGKIGLINLSDWFKASLNSNCTTTNSDWCPLNNYNRNDYECSFDNYLFNSEQTWSMNPNNLSTRYILIIGSYGCIGNASASVSDLVYVRPVVFLKNNVKVIKGSGTQNNPYILS